LYAPPRSTVGAAWATARAIVNTCSSPSTEHGPAMIASCGLPIATLPTEMIVSCGRKRAARELERARELAHRLHAGQRSTSIQSTAVESPTARDTGAASRARCGARRAPPCAAG
jgi:hypothetical protein